MVTLFDGLSIDALKALHFIFLHRDTTRLEIIYNLQISHLTVSNALKKLESKQIIYKSGKVQGESGRPSTTYRINGSIFSILGIYFDSETLQFVLSNASGELITSWEEVLSPEEISLIKTDGPVGILIEKISANLKSVHLKDRLQPQCLGISLPGMVDSVKGNWISGLQIEGIKSIPLKQILEDAFNIPVFIEDSSRSLVLLEKIFGKAQAYSNITLLYLGKGMGTGLIIDNKIVRGQQGTAGEIGHIPTTHSTYRCSCGNIGCFETIVSPYGILRIFEDRLKEGVSSSLQKFLNKNSYDLDLKKILEAAHAGDHLTIKTLVEIGEFIGDACDILIKLFNPEIIIISGIEAIFADFLKQSIISTINLRTPPLINKNIEIQFADYESNYEAWGAATMALNESLKGEISR